MTIFYAQVILGQVYSLKVKLLRPGYVRLGSLVYDETFTPTLYWVEFTRSGLNLHTQVM